MPAQHVTGEMVDDSRNDHAMTAWLQSTFQLAGTVPDVGLCPRHDRFASGWFGVVATRLGYSHAAFQALIPLARGGVPGVIGVRRAGAVP
jgi:hypothetical protein